MQRDHIIPGFVVLQVKLSEQDSNARECPLSRQVARWNTVFWLDLDYIEVLLRVQLFECA